MSIQLILKSLLIVMLATLIPACGGGDGNVVVEHPPKAASDYDDTDGADDKDE